MTNAQECGLMKVGVPFPSFPTFFIGNPGSSVVSDGSPIKNVGDDGEGKEPR